MSKKIPEADLSQNLQKFLKALRNGGGTATALASKLKCSKPTVYARVQALLHAGYDVRETKVREGKTGPEASHFTLAR